MSKEVLSILFRLVIISLFLWGLALPTLLPVKVFNINMLFARVAFSEVLRVENVGALPNRVRFTSFFPFSIILEKHDESVESWTHEFQSREAIKLLVSFDCRHLGKEVGDAFFDSKLEAHYLDQPGSVRNPIQLL
jgi:hypothetical protein